MAANYYSEHMQASFTPVRKRAAVDQCYVTPSNGNMAKEYRDFIDALAKGDHKKKMTQNRFLRTRINLSQANKFLLGGIKL